MKLKETFKTILLTGLVISTLVLSSKIWFSEELWPEGYNSFLSTFFSFFGENNADSLDLAQVYYPKQILILKNDRSSVISTTHDKYEELNNLIKEHLKSAIIDGEITDSNDEEYKKACKKDSLFIGLYSFTSFEMLADSYNVPKKDALYDINHVKNILLSPNEDYKAYSLFVKNNKTGRVFKILVKKDITSLSNLTDIVLNKIPEGTVAASFAFENNFDKKNENETEKILLDSYMLINLSGLLVPDISSVNFMDFSNDDFEKIAGYFNVNKNTARRFTDTNNTVNLVENFGTLKFHTDGLLEYISMDSGINMEGDISSDYDAVKLAGEFTEGINNLFSLPENNSYVFAGVSEDSNRVYTVSFDILYKGVPVVLSRMLSGKETMSHPIEIKIQNGKIISYRQLFCGFKKTGVESSVPDMISVLDKFYTVYDIKNNPDVIIEDIYSVYNYDIKNNKATTGNAVLLSDGKVVMVK